MRDLGVKRRKLLREVKDELGVKCVISLIYRDKCELENKDLRKINNFIKGIKSKNAVLILQGEGGYSGAGMSLSVLLRRKFNNGFLTLVPKKSCSALIYSILISNCVILGENSFITPIDPYFYYHGVGYRASYFIYSTNERIRKKARRHWENNVHFCLKILNEPGSIVMDPNHINLNKWGIIAKLLFLPKRHENQIDHNDFEKMGFRYHVYEESSSLSKEMEYIFESSMIELSQKNKRFLIESEYKSNFYPR